MGPIQLIPPGLLGLFQLKSSGRAPDDLQQSVQPSLEVLRWYMMARQVAWREPAGTFFTSRTVTTVDGPAVYSFNTPAPIRVPANEAWYVRSYTVAVPRLVVGDSVRFSAGWISPNSTQIAFTLADARSIVPTDNGLSSAHDFFLLPGSQLGVVVEAITSAAGIQFSGSLEYTPLPL